MSLLSCTCAHVRYLSWAFLRAPERVRNLVIFVCQLQLHRHFLKIFLFLLSQIALVSDAHSWLDLVLGRRRTCLTFSSSSIVDSLPLRRLNLLILS